MCYEIRGSTVQTSKVSRSIPDQTDFRPVLAAATELPWPRERTSRRGDISLLRRARVLRWRQGWVKFEVDLWVDFCCVLLTHYLRGKNARKISPLFSPPIFTSLFTPLKSPPAHFFTTLSPHAPKFSPTFSPQARKISPVCSTYTRTITVLCFREIPLAK